MISDVLPTSDQRYLLEFELRLVFTGGNLLSFFRMQLIEVRFTNTEGRENEGDLLQPMDSQFFSDFFTVNPCWFLRVDACRFFRLNDHVLEQK